MAVATGICAKSNRFNNQKNKLAHFATNIYKPR